MDNTDDIEMSKTQHLRQCAKHDRQMRRWQYGPAFMYQLLLQEITKCAECTSTNAAAPENSGAKARGQKPQTSRRRRNAAATAGK